MNILLEITTTNHKVWHSLAKRLQEIYPGSRFVAIIGDSSVEKQVTGYLTGQQDVRYENLYYTNEITKQALAGEIDQDVLRKFEEDHPDKSLWRLVASDRGWGHKFIGGAVFAKTFITENSSRENILKVFSGSIKAYRKIFDEFKPDIFIPAFCMGSINVHIFEALCRERNIPYIVPMSTRIKNIFAFSNDVVLHFPQITKTYQNLSQGREHLDLSKAQELYKELTAELEDPQYFDRKLACFTIKKITSPVDGVKLFFSTLRSIAGTVKRWPAQAKLAESQDVRRQPYKLSTLWDNIATVIKHNVQNAEVLSPKFGEILPEGQKYLYFPLHTSPEYSTQFQGTMWLDQIALIEMLAKSIPFDWVIYVKEHPARLSSRTRPMDFYKKITSFPNVKMAPIDMDMHELISNAQMVAVITGTSGWEAVLRGKPLINFADNYYDCMSLSRRCRDIELISVDIKEELKKQQGITKEERQKRITHFLAAILHHGFEITYPLPFNYELGPEEQYGIGGCEAADALVKYLEYLDGQQRKEPAGLSA